jgi:uncharacterized protein YyaL (SSP411 family)
MRLARLLDNESRMADARTLLEGESPLVESSPLAFGRQLALAGRMAAGPIEIAIIGADGGAPTAALLREVHRPFFPTRVVTGVGRGEAPPFATPLLTDRPAVGDAPTAYVCERFACQAPTADPAELASQLERLSASAR